MSRSSSVRREPGEKYIDLRSGRIGDDGTFIQPYKYREIPPKDWGPIAGPAREIVRERIRARESAALAAFCVQP